MTRTIAKQAVMVGALLAVAAAQASAQTFDWEEITGAGASSWVATSSELTNEHAIEAYEMALEDYNDQVAIYEANGWVVVYEGNYIFEEMGMYGYQYTCAVVGTAYYYY